MTPDVVKQIIDEVFTVLEGSSFVSGNVFLAMAIRALHAIADSLLPEILKNLNLKGIK